MLSRQSLVLRAQNSPSDKHRFLRYWQKIKIDGVIAKEPGEKLRKLSDMGIDITVFLLQGRKLKNNSNLWLQGKVAGYRKGIYPDREGQASLWKGTCWKEVGVGAGSFIGYRPFASGSDLRKLQALLQINKHIRIPAYQYHRMTTCWHWEKTVARRKREWKIILYKRCWFQLMRNITTKS